MKTITSLFLALLLSVNVFGQWEECAINGETTHEFGYMLATDLKLYLMTNNKVFRSDDSGQTWNVACEGYRFETIANSGEILYASEANLWKLFKSTDYGVTWQDVTPEWPWPTTIKAIDVFNDDVYAVMGGTAFVSHDNAITWTNLYLESTNNLTKLSENTYLWEYGSQIRKTTDNMNSWYTVYSSSKNDGKENFKKSKKYIHTGSNIYMGKLSSTDNGESFSEVLSDYLDDVIYYNGRIYGVTWWLNPKLHFSYDYENWYPIPLPDEADAPTQLLEYDNFLYIFYYGKIFRHNIATITINDLKKQQLFTVYPNPLKNNKINIKYNLDQKETVTIELFNIVGKKIKTFINKEQNQGNYNNQFMLNLKQGVYVIKFTTNGRIISKKIIIN